MSGELLAVAGDETVVGSVMFAVTALAAVAVLAVPILVAWYRRRDDD